MSASNPFQQTGGGVNCTPGSDGPDSMLTYDQKQSLSTPKYV